MNLMHKQRQAAASVVLPSIDVLKRTEPNLIKAAELKMMKRAKQFKLSMLEENLKKNGILAKGASLSSNIHHYRVQTETKNSPIYKPERIAPMMDYNKKRDSSNIHTTIESSNDKLKMIVSEFENEIRQRRTILLTDEDHHKPI